MLRKGENREPGENPGRSRHCNGLVMCLDATPTQGEGGAKRLNPKSVDLPNSGLIGLRWKRPCEMMEKSHLC